MKRQLLKIHSFSQLLFTYSVVLVISLLLFGSLLFAIVFRQLSAVQEQTSRYATVMQLATQISKQQEAFNRFIVTENTSSQQIQALSDMKSAEARAKVQLQKLETSYEINPEQYFLLRGIRNGLDFIAQQQAILIEQIPLDVAGFTRYYVIETTYSHLNDYVYSESRCSSSR